MILGVYCYYNKLLEAFGNYQLDDHAEEQVALYLQRDLKASFLRGDNVSKFKELDLYKLGTFDDQTGEFVNDKHLIVDLGNCLAQLEAAKVSSEKKEGN